MLDRGEQQTDVEQEVRHFIAGDQVATLGVGIALQNAMAIIVGPDPVRFPPLVPAAVLPGCCLR